MAINKVVNTSTKSHAAMRNVIIYILSDEKVREGYVLVTGPYNFDEITTDNIYTAFLNEKLIWNKDSGRMYAHNVISFHKDENITPEQCLEIGQAFADKFFPNHQCIIAIHQDKDHLHVHTVTNSVSYIDGHKLHQTKRDLEKQKEFTNQLCLERGLTIAEKGLHFDGTKIEEGTIIAWSKDKYHLMANQTKKSFVVDCAIAVLESREGCCSKDDFLRAMEEHGWKTTWTEEKKHITFENDNGDKVRDSNISKTFSMDISKEALNAEFERQNRLKDERENQRRQQESEFESDIIIRAIEQRESEAARAKSEIERRSRDYSKLRRDSGRNIREQEVYTERSKEVVKNRRKSQQQGISLED